MKDNIKKATIQCLQVFGPIYFFGFIGYLLRGVEPASTAISVVAIFTVVIVFGSWLLLSFFGGPRNGNIR